MDRRSMLLRCALLGLGAPAAARAHHGAKQRVDGAIAGWRVDTFTLSDPQGRQFTQDGLQAHWSFLLFGHTADCSEGCTQALDTLAGMWHRIERTQKLATTLLVFVALDEQRDTPQRLQRLLGTYDVPIIGCSGTTTMVRRLTDDLGVPADTRGSLWLIGPDRAVRGEFLPPFDVKLLTAAYLKLRMRG